MGDMRAEERISAAWPVNLGDSMGVTRDISASGISFETSASLNLGSPIQFKVDLDGPNGKMVLKCSGRIVRAVTLDAGMRVAVKIEESAMEVAQ